MPRLLLILLLFAVNSVTVHAHLSSSGLGNNRQTATVRRLDPSDVSPWQSETVSPASAEKIAPPVIILSVGQYLSGIALLSWTTSDTTLAGIYYIERQVVPSATWATLAQLPYTAILKYSDTISFPHCTSADFVYRIRFVENLTSQVAISNSSITLTLHDQTFPANVKDVFVNNSLAGPVLFWKQVAGDEIYGYMIARLNGSVWDSITTVAADSNRFVDRSVTDGCLKTYKYVIVSIDMCGNRSAPDYSQFVQTLNLNMPAIDNCERLAKLTWNPFTVMPGGLGGYKVFRSIDSGSPVLVTTITDTLLTSYKYNDGFPFQKGHFYSYYIQAVSISGAYVSSSCVQGSLFNGSGAPDSVYIKQVSVESDSYVSISFHQSPLNTVKKIILERADFPGTIFFPIDSLVTVNDYLSSDIIMNDTTANVHNQSYSYRITALDSCGTTRLYSNISRTILLQCSATQTQNTLGWNEYATWLQGVEAYKVFRTSDGQPAAGDSIASVTPPTHSFPDFLTGVDPTKKICYWVKASEISGNPYLNKAVSLSNTCCIIKDPVLFIPDAFHPGGKNGRFRPVPKPLYVDPQSFKMKIWSRWGQQIFETTDMVNGWDGMVNGHVSPSGLYVYVFTFTSLAGKEYTKRGTVMLVK